MERTHEITQLKKFLTPKRKLTRPGWAPLRNYSTSASSCRLFGRANRSRRHEGSWAGSRQRAISLSYRADRCFAKQMTGSYELIPPTPTADRTCAALRVCNELEYQVVAPSAFHDRRCAPVTTCVKGEEFEATRPTRISDRICLNDSIQFTPLRGVKSGVNGG